MYKIVSQSSMKYLSMCEWHKLSKFVSACTLPSAVMVLSAVRGWQLHITLTGMGSGQTFQYPMTKGLTIYYTRCYARPAKVCI